MPMSKYEGKGGPPPQPERADSTLSQPSGEFNLPVEDAGDDVTGVEGTDLVKTSPSVPTPRVTSSRM